MIVVLACFSGLARSGNEYGLKRRLGWRLSNRRGGVGDPCGVVSVDGGEGAEEQAVDVGKDGGATRGNAVLGEEFVEVAEGVVDALGGLKALGAANERLIDVALFGFLPQGEMVRTETRARVQGQSAALTAVGVAVDTALGR